MYEEEIAALRGYYEKAVADIRRELLQLSLTDFERAEINATLTEVKRILADLDEKSSEWVKEMLPVAITAGVIASLLALGFAEGKAGAREIAKLNRLNRDYLKTVIADTEADLAQVSRNIERKTRIAMRQAAAEASRKAATKKDIARQIESATRTGIIDAAGRRWKPEVYADMLARTKMAEAQREAAVNDALGRNVQYAVISSHGAKDACRFWEGRTISLVRGAPGGYPYIGDLPNREIFHPNCRHVITPVRRPE